jgi:hypothetical protein
MSAGSYALLFTILPFLYGGAVVWAERIGGVRTVRLTWALAAIMYAVLGYADWRTPPDEGTPLAFYIVLALVPTAAGAWVALWAARRQMPLPLRVIASGSATWLMVFPVLVLFTALG